MKIMTICLSIIQKTLSIMSKKEIRAAIIITIAWSLLALGIIWFTKIMDPKIFFVIWFNGLLGIIVLIDPHDEQSSSIRYLNYLTIGGMVLFAYIIVERILDVLI